VCWSFGVTGWGGIRVAGYKPTESFRQRKLESNDEDNKDDKNKLQR